MRAPKDQWFDVPIVAFFLEHPTVGPMLVDTGFHPSVAVDPKQNLGPMFGRFYKVDMKPEEAIAAQLRARGVEPDQVKVVIMTTCIWTTPRRSRSSPRRRTCSASESGARSTRRDRRSADTCAGTSAMPWTIAR